MYWQIEFVFVLSTSNCHHVNPPAVVKCKMVDSDCYGLKVKMSMALERTLFPRNLFQHPRCWSLLCLQWHCAWCPLVTVFFCFFFLLSINIHTYTYTATYNIHVWVGCHHTHFSLKTEGYHTADPATTQHQRMSSQQPPVPPAVTEPAPW